MTRAPLPLVRRYAVEAVAVGLAVLGVVDAWQHPFTWDGFDKGPEWLVRSVPLVLTLPLLVRRVFPVAAPAAVFAAAVAASFVSAEAVYGTSSNLVALLLASLVLGLNERRVALAGLALVVLAVAVVNLNAIEFTWGDFFFPAIFLGITWFLGHLWWEREERLRAATQRIAAAEREREQAAAAAVQAERERIAGELHDVIAHSVSVMTVQAGAVRRLLRPEQEREREALLAVEETGRQALGEMRRLLAALRREDEQPELEPQPSLRTLEALVEHVRRAGLPVDVRYEGERVDLPPGVDLSAARIVQEALASALEHRGPDAHAWVAVRYGETDVEVEVANDVAAADGDGGEGKGLLLALRERVALCGGELRAGPRDGGGFSIRARLPVSRGPA